MTFNFCDQLENLKLGTVNVKNKKKKNFNTQFKSWPLPFNPNKCASTYIGSVRKSGLECVRVRGEELHFLSMLMELYFTVTTQCYFCQTLCYIGLHNDVPFTKVFVKWTETG